MVKPRKVNLPGLLHHQLATIRLVKATILIALTLATALSSGCQNAGQGAVSGAGIGALSGLAIGSLTGSAGKGAAIGAIVGGVGGAVVGDQNRRKAEQAAATPPPPQTVVVQQSYQTGSALGRLIGNWNIQGTVNASDGASLPVSGTARATVDKVYFVRFEVQMTDPRNGQVVDGTMVISQTGNRGLAMTNSFSSSPEVKHFTGEMDASATVFNFAQTSPANSSRQIVFRMSSGLGFTADVWDGSRRVESFTFTPA